jgi:hypothetical protein
VGLDLQEIKKMIGALKEIADAHCMPFAFTPKFKVTTSQQTTPLGNLPGIIFSVNFTALIPYFFMRTHAVMLSDIFLFDFGEYTYFSKSDQRAYIPKGYLGSIMKLLWRWNHKEIPNFIWEVAGNPEHDEEISLQPCDSEVIDLSGDE